MLLVCTTNRRYNLVTIPLCLTGQMQAEDGQMQAEDGWVQHTAGAQGTGQHNPITGPFIAHGKGLLLNVLRVLCHQ